MPRCLLAALFAGAALAAAGCGETKSPSGEVNAAPAPASSAPASASAASAPVLSASASETLDKSFVVSGPIIVEHQVDITAEHEGVIAKILFDAPERVQAGTVLARMDDRQLAANLEAARAKSRSIENDLKNWEA